MVLAESIGRRAADADLVSRLTNDLKQVGPRVSAGCGPGWVSYCARTLYGRVRQLPVVRMGRHHDVAGPPGRAVLPPNLPPVQTMPRSASVARLAPVLPPLRFVASLACLALAACGGDSGTGPALSSTDEAARKG